MTDNKLSTAIWDRGYRQGVEDSAKVAESISYGASKEYTNMSVSIGTKIRRLLEKKG